MGSGLCLHGQAPLPSDKTSRANKYLKLQMRKLDAITSWHSRKWPFHAQIRGFAKVNTQSSMEDNVWKKATCWTHSRSTQASGGRFWVVCSWLEYAAVPAMGCTAILLWSAIAVKRGVFKSPCTVVRLLWWPVGLIELFVALQGLFLGFSLNTEKQCYYAVLGRLELQPLIGAQIFPRRTGPVTLFKR